MPLPSEQRWFIGRVTRFLSSGLPRIVVEHINISVRNLAEEQSRRSKQAAEAEANRSQFQHSFIRAINEVSPDGILAVDDAGVIASHNQKLLDIWQIVLPVVGDKRSESAVGQADHLVLSEAA